MQNVAESKARAIARPTGRDDELGGGLIGLLPVILEEIKDIRRVLDGRQKDYYTVEEVADLAGRKPYTVRAWIKGKKIEATRIEGTGPKGRLLIHRSQLRMLIGSGHGGQIPDDLA
ncbi:helix-turn-helix domain-containing protein [Tundrisphaera lichenicola]|uniref:helix-turn-helix domain-containing protein n=1 Tax=Tundrisphaera lichenicola TaxID=2029860 RepID=UPI003EBAC687